MTLLPLRPPRHPAGFTLVELLIVVTILGILAAIVVPQMASSADEARHAQFAENLRSIVTACQIAMEVNGDVVEDAGCGSLPAELTPFFDASTWARVTPLGGLWDTEQNMGGVASSVGVHFHGVPSLPDAEMAEVDALLDDGDISTGAFRKLGTGRFHFVLTE